MPPTKSLCFLETSFGANNMRISEEAALWHMVQHFRGERHNTCFPKLSGMIGLWEPVTNSIAKVAVKDNYEALNEDEAMHYEGLLLNTLHGKLEAVKASFNDVKRLRDPYANPVQPIGVLAAFKGHLDIMQFVLESGAELDSDLAWAIRHGAEKSPEMSAYYEQNKTNYDEMIMARNQPPSGYVPNVPDEWRARIEATCPR